jgi:hypothetical protein
MLFLKLKHVFKTGEHYAIVNKPNNVFISHV